MVASSSFPEMLNTANQRGIKEKDIPVKGILQSCMIFGNKDCISMYVRQNEHRVEGKLGQG